MGHAKRIIVVAAAFMLAFVVAPSFAFAVGGASSGQVLVAAAEGNQLPVLAEGVGTSQNLDAAFEDDFTFDPSGLFVDPDGDELAYYVSVDGASAAAWNAESTLAWTTVGRHTVAITAHDGTGMSQAKHTLRVTVKRRIPNHDVTVSVFGAADVEFFVGGGYDIDGCDVPGDALVATATEGGYTVSMPYDISFVSFRAVVPQSEPNAGRSLGGMAVAVDNDTSELALRVVEVAVPGSVDGQAIAPDQMTLSATYGDHRAAVGGGYENEGSLCYGFLAVADGATGYAFEAMPSGDAALRYDSGTLAGQVIEPGEGTLRFQVNLVDLGEIELESSLLTVYRNTPADTALHLKAPHTGTFELAQGATMPEGLALFADGSVKGMPTADVGSYSVNVLVKNELAPEGVSHTVTVTVKEQFSYLGLKTEAKVYDNWDSDLWLTAQQVRMEVGDKFGFEARRLPFIGNNGGLVSPPMIYPTFHIQKIYGDSVDIPEMLESYALDSKGIIGWSYYRSLKRQYPVTALHPGTTIVQVTYDSYEGFDIDDWVPYLSGSDPLDYPACPDCNVAYMVFTVGETGTASVKSSIDSWSCYSTVYFSDEEVHPFDITASAPGAMDFWVTCNGLKVEPAADGTTYTLPLENRANIIGMVATDAYGNQRSTWRIIDARYLEVNVDNLTNPGSPIAPGDTAKVSFDGLMMPLQRLSGYYNPQMRSADYATNTSFRIRYHNEQLGEFEGACHQWDLAQCNSFEVTFPDEGDYVFEGIDVNGKWWGAPLGTELAGASGGFETDDDGNAPENEGSFCQGMIPNFTVHVEEPQGKYKRIRGTAYLSVGKDGKFWESNGIEPGVAMTRVPIDLAQLSEIDLAAYGLDAFDYDADGDGQYETTLLHLLIWANERYSAAGAGGLGVTEGSTPGSLWFSDLFRFGSTNLNYYVNGVYPLERPGWGATADTIVLADGDYVDVGWYTATMTSSSFQYFTGSDGQPVFEIEAYPGKPCMLQLARTVPAENYTTAMVPVGEGATVHYGVAYDEAQGQATTDASGIASVVFLSTGDYVVWADGAPGTEDEGGQVAPAFAVVHVVPEPALPDLAAATAVVNGGEPVVYAGAPCEPAIVLYGTDGNLIDPACYAVSYAGNDAAGNAVAVVASVAGKATGVKVVPFTILPTPAPEPSDFEMLSAARVTLAKTSFAYTGKAVTPAVTVKNAAGKVLAVGTDYTVEYSSNVNAGTAKATVKGKGLYVGSVAKGFTISKGKNAFKVSANAAKKAVAVKAGKALAAKKYAKVGKRTFGGKVAYKLAKAPAKIKKSIKVDANTGKIKVAKKAKKGTYIIKVMITSKESANFVAQSSTVELKLKVR